MAASLIKQGHDVNLGDKAGWTPLHFAAQANSVDCARILLDSGAMVDAEDSNGNTSLSTAVFNSKGQGDLIVFLLSKGADPEKKNHHGQSSIGLAQIIANYDLLQFFGKNTAPNKALFLKRSQIKPMKYAALIFVIVAGALKAEIPAGATDLVPRTDSPAAESLKMKDEPTATMTYSEITIISLDSKSSIEVPSVYLSKDSKSEKKK